MCATEVLNTCDVWVYVFGSTSASCVWRVTMVVGFSAWALAAQWAML